MQRQNLKYPPKKVSIIGGAAIDVISQLNPQSFTKFDQFIDNSNIGKIDMRVGGSTRNATECLLRLGFCKELQFISALGQLDVNTKGQMIINSINQLGLTDCEERFIVKNNYRSAAFTGVLDPNGDFKLGIADMEVLEHIPLEHIEQFQIEKSQIIVIDGNIGPQTIQQIQTIIAFIYLTQSHPQEIIFEPISNEKLQRVHKQKLLGFFSCIKLNTVQLESLKNHENQQLSQEKFVENFINDLYNTSQDQKNFRLNTIIITKGKDGVHYIKKTADKIISIILPSIQVNNDKIKSVMGAGDSFLAGYIYAIVTDLNKHNKQDSQFTENQITNQLQFGQMCASLTVQSDDNVSENIHTLRYQ